MATAIFGINHRVIAAIMAIVPLLGGCILSGSGDSEQIYDLSAPEQITSVRKSTAQLIVATPDAIAAFDNSFIVIKPGGGQIAYFGKAKWSDTLPKLIQARIIEAFERSNAVRAVSEPGRGIAADFQLLITITDFQIDRLKDNRFSARVGLFVKVVNQNNGRVIGNIRITKVQPASGDRVIDAIPALEQAFASSLKALVSESSRYLD